MVPEFEAHDRINEPWFLDWDNDKWYYHDAESGQILDHKPIVVPKVDESGWPRRRV